MSRSIRIVNGSNFIELEIQIEIDTTLPSYGDALIAIVVSSNGFTAKNQVWVHQLELARFVKSLKQLEYNGKGEAILKSMSPDEMKLKFYAYDNLGHMAIKGKTGYWVYKEIDVFHSTQFGFDFDPSNLGKLLKFNWLLKN